MNLDTLNGWISLEQATMIVIITLVDNTISWMMNCFDINSSTIGIVQCIIWKADLIGFNLVNTCL